jgi:hypothetical protein
MNAEQLPAALAGTYQVVRDRQERLRAEARDERLARAARAPRPPSRGWANRMSFVVRTLGIGTTGGTD